MMMTTALHISHIFHTDCMPPVPRTPDAREAMAARSCNVVLSRWTLTSFDCILRHIRQAEAMPRSSQAAGGSKLSAPQVSSRAALQAFKMPTTMT